MFKKQIAIVTVGDTHFGFQDVQQAMQLISLMSESVVLDGWLYSVRDYTQAEYALKENGALPQLKFVRESAIDGQHTVDEIKERGDREKKDREDMEQQMNAAPLAIAAPGVEVTSADDEVPE